MSPPKTNGTNLSQPRTNGFVGSSSSSTGTVPRMNGGIGSGGGRMPSDPPRTNTNNQGGIIGGSESGVSTTGTGNSGALNNTVLPGIRANNYWDNFRSFSRQNRLSSAVAANNIPGLTPVVA